MRIEQIDFIDTPAFKNHKVHFKSIPKIGPIFYFLVGENGSGKTNILEAIKEAINNHMYAGNTYGSMEITFKLNKKELTDKNLKRDIVIYNGRPGAIPPFRDITGLPLNKYFSVPVAYLTSELEKYTKDLRIKSSTNEDFDRRNLELEKSNELSKKIPQLLVDIEVLDNKEKIKWLHENKNKSYEDIPSNIGSRIDRINKALRFFFGDKYDFIGTSNDETNKDKDIRFIDLKGNNISLDRMSTGEQQIIFKTVFLIKDLGKVQEGSIILIDEPEIGLHPSWQIKYRSFLEKLFKDLDVQIIISTHSPYIFNEFKSDSDVCVKIDRNALESKEVEIKIPNIQNRVTSTLISYLVYGTSSLDLHVELYSLLQDKYSCGPTDVNKHIRLFYNQLGEPLQEFNFKTSKEFNNKPIDTPITETLPTRIRNKMNHRDEKNRLDFTDKDVDESIGIMLKMLP